VKTFADLADLADSGETEGRLANRGGIWFQVQVEVNPDLPATGVNRPGTVVFASRSTRWTYPVEDLRRDGRLRFAIRMTAAQRALSAAASRGDENEVLRWRAAIDGLEAHRPAPRRASA
jgi:hypothetical protein